MKQKQMLGIVALAMVALLGVGMVSAFGFGNRVSEEDRDALENAIESGDYEAWREIKLSQISEESFEEARAQYQERLEFREARESGDYSRLQELREEYGFEGNGFGRGMNYLRYHSVE